MHNAATYYAMLRFRDQHPELIRSYPDDLPKYDRGFLARSPEGARFLWVAYEYGTHILSLHPYPEDPEPRRCNSREALAMNYAAPGSWRNSRFFLAHAGRLVELTAVQAVHAAIEADEQERRERWKLERYQQELEQRDLEQRRRWREQRDFDRAESASLSN